MTKHTKQICLTALIVAAIGCGGTQKKPVAAVPTDWAALESAALAEAQKNGETLVATHRFNSDDIMSEEGNPCVVKTPMVTVLRCVNKQIQVEAGNCYTIGVAWSSSESARGYAQFLDSSGYVAVDMAAPAGSFNICADTNTGVDVQIYPANDNPKHLEYAVAVASKAETAEEKSARVERTKQAVADAQASVETNIFLSELRDHGQPFALSCQRCRKLGTDCNAEAGSDPSACRTQFETCAQAVGVDRYGRVLCNPGDL